MWGKLTSYVGGQQENDGARSNDGQGQADDPELSDAQLQQIEQEKMILQLKEMIRDRELQLSKKEAEFKGAEFSKHKLQSKAKITSLTQQLEQAQKSASESLEKASCGSDESISTVASETASTVSEQTARAKSSLLRKKLRDRDQLLKEKDAELERRQKEIGTKEKVIEEREAVIDNLRSEIEQLRAAISRDTENNLDPSPVEESKEKDPLEVQLQEMYAQMIYKDRKILELSNKITDLDCEMMNLRELVSEKDEVIRGRDKAIKLLSASLGTASVPGLTTDHKPLSADVSHDVVDAQSELDTRQTTDIRRGDLQQDTSRSETVVSPDTPQTEHMESTKRVRRITLSDKDLDLEITTKTCQTVERSKSMSLLLEAEPEAVESRQCSTVDSTTMTDASEPQEDEKTEQRNDERLQELMKDVDDLHKLLQLKDKTLA